MSEITQAQAVKVLHKLAGKQDPPEKLPSVAAFAKEAGIEQSKAGAIMWAAEPVAYPSLKLPATANGVKKGRAAGLRMERLISYTGLTRARVNELAEQGGVDLNAYIGRGRRRDGSAAATSSSTKSTTAKAATSGRGRGTSGRRAQANAGKGRGRRGATAADPS